MMGYSGPKTVINLNGIWDLKPSHLGPWILRFHFVLELAQVFTLTTRCAAFLVGAC